MTTLITLFWMGAAAAAADPYALAEQADMAYNNKNYPRCVELYQQATALVEKPEAGMWYSLACCQALASQRDAAFGSLLRAAELGFRYTGPLQEDADLGALHADPRWKVVVDAVAAQEKKAAGGGSPTQVASNPELKGFFDAEQAASKSGMEDPAQARSRLEKVRQLAASPTLVTASDYAHAAFVLVHSPEKADHLTARTLASRAAELDPGLTLARSTLAAATDRCLWDENKPQIYGTQLKKTSEGPWTLEPFDRAGATDEQRRAMAVPSLMEIETELRRLNTPTP